jgi:hypothetical protein
MLKKIKHRVSTNDKQEKAVDNKSTLKGTDMFYGQCNACGERWSLGAASTCKCPKLPDYRFTMPCTSAKQSTLQDRVWIGLTDDEYKELHLEMGPVYYYQDYGRAIEEKLREKNT